MITPQEVFGIVGDVMEDVRDCYKDEGRSRVPDLTFDILHVAGALQAVGVSLLNGAFIEELTDPKLRFQTRMKIQSLTREFVGQGFAMGADTLEPVSQHMAERYLEALAKGDEDPEPEPEPEQEPLPPPTRHKLRRKRRKGAW